MSDQQHRGRTIVSPCRLCGAPVGMGCVDYAHLRQVNAGFDLVAEAVSDVSGLRVGAQIDRIGVPVGEGS